MVVVRSVDFVGDYDCVVFVDVEFVFCIDEDEVVFVCYFFVFCEECEGIV